MGACLRDPPLSFLGKNELYIREKAGVRGGVLIIRFGGTTKIFFFKGIGENSK